MGMQAERFRFDEGLLCVVLAMCCACTPRSALLRAQGAPLFSALELGLTCFEGVGLQTPAHTLYQVSSLTVFWEQ